MLQRVMVTFKMEGYQSRDISQFLEQSGARKVHISDFLNFQDRYQCLSLGRVDCCWLA